MKKKHKLDTIVEEEEETRTFQISAGATSDQITEDKFDQSDMSDVPDDEDNAVVIVDLADIVHNKDKGYINREMGFMNRRMDSSNKGDKKEGSHDCRLAGDDRSKRKLELVQRRHSEKEDCPHGKSEAEMKPPEKKRIKKDRAETPFSTNKGNAAGCSSRDESQPETSRPIAETRAQQHPTGSVVVDIEEVVENLPQNQSWSSLFNWDNFGYSLILGFIPTAWDVFSDLMLAEELKKEESISAAGLSYLFICFPGLYIFNEALTEKLSSHSSIIVLIVNFCWTVALSSAMIYAYSVHTLLFRLPAILIGILVLVTKGLAIFVHTPEMKKVVDRMTMGEFKTEAPLQLLLLLHLWVSGHPLFVTPILSSLLVIGKVNAEMYLSDEPDNLMKGKSFLQKLLLTLKYVPLFTSTAFFRLGCGILKHSGPYASEVSETFHALVFFLSVSADGVFSVLCYLLIFAGVKLGFPGSLADITFEELGRSTHAEFTTVSNWGRLGRDRSK